MPKPATADGHAVKIYSRHGQRTHVLEALNCGCHCVLLFGVLWQLHCSAHLAVDLHRITNKDSRTSSSVFTPYLRLWCTWQLAAAGDPMETLPATRQAETSASLDTTSSAAGYEPRRGTFVGFCVCQCVYVFQLFTWTGSWMESCTSSASLATGHGS